MAFDFHKAQDAIVTFLKGFLLRVASLFARLGATSDEIGQTADAAEKSIQALTPEVKQVFDAAEAALNEIRQSAKGVDISVTTPSGGTWSISARQAPPKEAEKP